MEKNIFEVAAREKYRFPFNGSISVEDLYDLTVRQLDSIYKTLNVEVKKADEDSLLEVKTPIAEELDNKINIIKYVVSYKLAAVEKAQKAEEIAQKKQRIMELISDKQDEELKSKSTEELEELLKSLDNQ